MTDRVVQSKESLAEVEVEQKREVVQSAQQIFGFEVLEAAGCAHRRGRRRWGSPRPRERRRVRRNAPARSRTKARGSRRWSERPPWRGRSRSFGSKTARPLTSSRLFAPTMASLHRLSALDDFVAQEAVDHLEELRPFAEARGELRETSCVRAQLALAAGRPRAAASASPACMASTGWRTAFSGRTLSIRVVTRRTQFGPPCRNGLRSCSRQTSSTIIRMRRSPRASASFPAAASSVCNVRALASQHHDLIQDDLTGIGLFAEHRPQNSVEIGVLNVRVMGERLGEGRLAVAAGAAQRRRDRGDRVAFGVEELRLQRVELFGARNEVRRRLRRHHGRRAFADSRP